VADVFVSYQRADEPRVSILIKALEGTGLTVWWDRHLPGAVAWRQEIERQLDCAKIVIVCWSAVSVGAQGSFVQDEAGRAGDRLLPLLLDRVKPPLGFGEVQAFNLVGWRGRVTDLAFTDVIEAIRARLVGAPPPRLRAPAIRAARTFVFGGGLLAVTSVAVVLAWTSPSVRLGVCAAPIGQPYLSEACCKAGFTPGHFSQAKAKSIRTIERVGYLRQGVQPVLDTSAGQADAKMRLQEDASILCSSGGVFGNLVSSEADVLRYHCRSGGGGVFCAADYKALCTYEYSEAVERCEK